MENEVIYPIIHTSLTDDEKLHHPYWMVVLSNGIVVYSKSGRRSWLELKSWLHTHPVYNIVKLCFGFRSHTETVVEGPDKNYFFTYSMLADSVGWSQYYFIGGYQDGDRVITRKYIVPEIFLVEEDSRSLDDPSVVRGLIIKN